MVGRISGMRDLLCKSIENFGSHHNWEHIINQVESMNMKLLKVPLGCPFHGHA